MAAISAARGRVKLTAVDFDRKRISLSMKACLDENGEELPMKAGKTFIQIVENEQPVVVYSDSAIAGAKAL